MSVALGIDSNLLKRARTRPYRWLAAGALTLGIAAAFGSGTAHADASSSASVSDGSRSAGAPVKSPIRGSNQRGEGLSAATSKTAAAARGPAQVRRTGADHANRTALVPPVISAVAAGANATPSLQSQFPGYATFGYTGGSQNWDVPAGVLSAFVSATGGSGGNGDGGDVNGGVANFLNATLTLSGRPLSAPITQLAIVIGGAGQSLCGGVGCDSKSGGAGGFNGGAPGGSGSNASWGGGGGGGATQISVSAGGPTGIGTLLVAGGGGGGGGQSNGSGGTGGVGGQAPSAGGIWPGGSGTAASGDNGGGGGAGSNQPSANGSSGGNAETLSGNGGGGGGGGGWLGGSGGQPGQASLDPFATAGAGGGGGGGSSYADPTLATNVSVVPTQWNEAAGGLVGIAWVDFSTTVLQPMQVRLPANQYIVAFYEGGPGTPLTWQVTAGALPPGVTLNGNFLGGTPKKGGYFSFQVTATAPSGAASAWTYSGNVCTKRCQFPNPKKAKPVPR